MRLPLYFTALPPLINQTAPIRWLEGGLQRLFVIVNTSTGESQQNIAEQAFSSVWRGISSNICAAILMRGLNRSVLVGLGLVALFWVPRDARARQFVKQGWPMLKVSFEECSKIYCSIHGSALLTTPRNRREKISSVPRWAFDVDFYEARLDNISIPMDVIDGKERYIHSHITLPFFSG